MKDKNKKLNWQDFQLIKTALKEKSSKLVDRIEILAEIEELEEALERTMEELQKITILIEKLERR